MLRLLEMSGILGWFTPFVHDVERQEVPLGLLQIIDVLVDSLLPGGADPVIHFDARYMYSTLDVVKGVAPVLTALGVSPGPEVRPVVFFLPAGDPSNALLMPILAHEVGHAAVERGDLGGEVLRRVDATKLNGLFATCLARAGNPDPTPWQIHFVGWLDELLCDALATVLCGPSMLFAAAAFLPASDPGTLGSHPFPGDRIRLCLEQLSELGWDEVLNANCPNTTTWLRALTPPLSSGDPREEFLRGSVDLLKEPLLAVAKEHASGALNPQDFRAVSHRLAELITAQIPPAQVDGDPADPWAITLAAWLRQFVACGDSVGALAAAVSNREFNDFVHKSIEMARIARLWRDS
jgi:hypothetical protein